MGQHWSKIGSTSRVCWLSLSGYDARKMWIWSGQDVVCSTYYVPLIWVRVAHTILCYFVALVWDIHRAGILMIGQIWWPLNTCNPSKQPLYNKVLSEHGSLIYWCQCWWYCIGTFVLCIWFTQICNGLNSTAFDQDNWKTSQPSQ